MNDSLYTPLSVAFPSEFIRDDVAAFLSPFMDSIAYIDGFALGDDEANHEIYMQLELLEDIVIDFPVAEGLALVIGSGEIEVVSSSRNGPLTIPSPIEEEDGYDYDIEYPLANSNVAVRADIVGSLIHVRIPRNWLHPAKLNDDGEYVRDDNPAVFVEIGIPLGISITENFDIEILVPGEESTAITLPPCFIGNTPILIEASDIKLDLSRMTSIDEVATAGYGPEFVGILIGEASARFPNTWQVDLEHPTSAVLVVHNLIVGTGGVSGAIVIEATNSGDLLHYRFEDFQLGLSAASITFDHSTIVDADIHGLLTIPGFDGGPLEVEIQPIGSELSIAFCSENGPTISLADVLSFKIACLKVGSRDGEFFLGVSGLLSFNAVSGFLGDSLPKDIDISQMIIWSNGAFEFEGGAIALPKVTTMSVGPLELSVSALHIGGYEQDWGGQRRKYKYIGFDGGVKTGFGGVDARGEGVKLYFTVDNGPGKDLHTFLRIQGIEVDIRIPGGVPKEVADLIIKGYIAMKSPQRVNPNDPGGDTIPQDPNETNVSTEYSGTVDVAMPRVGMAGGASLRMIPSTGAFLADMFMEMPVPILLGATGLGIYGFRGTVGNKYVVEKEENESWWEFYKKPERGIDSRKFKQRDGVSVGAGTSIGTAADGGRSFSAKVYFMLSVPTAFIMEGQGSILSKRLGLDTDEDPPFYAGLIVDFAAGSITAGIGVHLEIPEGGDVLSLDANMELAFYFGRTSGWHIYIGQEEPDKRIRGRLLRLFDSSAYFMLSAKGIKAGAGIDWKFKQDCGIVVIGLGASLEISGFVSFKPVQLGGKILLAGFAELKLLGIGFRLSVEASLEAEAPNPFIIRGAFSLELDLPWPVPNLSLGVSMAWYIRRELDKKEICFLLPPHSKDMVHDEVGGYTTGYGLAQYKEAGKYAAKAVHMLTRDPFLLNVVKRAYIPADPGSSAAMPGDPPAPLFGEQSGTPGLNQWIGSFDEFIIPVDSYLDIEFGKPVKPVVADDDDDAGGDHTSINRLGLIQGGKRYNELVPPQRGASNQVEHRYLVDNVKVYYWDAAGFTWRDYNMYDLNTPLLRILSQQNLQKYLKYGHWQLSEAGEYTKLRMLARTPFDLYDTLAPPNAGFPETTVLCPDDGFELTCLTWNDEGLDPNRPAGIKIFDRKLSYIITDQDATIVDYTDPFGLGKSLKLEPGNRIEIFLPEGSRKLQLKLTTLAERVSISYYRGQAYTPSNDSTAEDGVERWNISIPAPSDLSEETNDSIWEMLRKMPGLVRTVCTSPGDPQSSTPTTNLKTLLDERYFLSDLYLKQSNNEAALSSTVDLCTKLRSMLRSIILGKTGSIAIPRRLQLNVEHFYRDVKRYVGAYAGVFGEPSTSGVTDANEFYEAWTELIACIGKLCDRKGSLPNRIKDKIARLLNPEIDRLYRKLEEANWYGLQLNPRWGLMDPCDQLRSIAGFFSVLSLDLATLSSIGAMEPLEPYFVRLEGAYLCTVRTMRQADPALCRGGDCGFTPQIVSIVRTLCIDPQVTGGTLTSIQNLVGDFHANRLAEFIDYFGWDIPQTNPSDLCGRLRRVLSPVIVALSMIDQLPFQLRWKVRAFYDRLYALVEEYRTATQDAPKGTPNPASDAFVMQWVEMLACLCRMCEAETLPEESYLASAIDPELETVYNAIAGEIFTTMRTQSTSRRPMFGSGVPSDACQRVDDLISFFAAAFTRCESMSSDMRSQLDDLYTSMTTHYQALSSSLSGSTICGGTSSTLNCQIWPVIFECVRAYRSRQWEMAKSVREEIETVMAPLVETMYRKIFSVVLPDPIPVPGDRESMLWELEELIGYFRQYCLKGLDAPGQSSIQTELTALQSAVVTLRLNPDFVEADICEVDGYDTCDRRHQLIRFHRLLCTDPPVVLPPNWPSAGINTRITNFGASLNEIITILGLDPVSLVQGDERSFCDLFGDLVRIMVIAYAHVDELPLYLVYRMKKFVDDMTDAIALTGATEDPVSPPSCVATSDLWFDRLECLCGICYNRDYLNLFTGAEAAFDALQENLEMLYAEALVIADAMGLEFLPGRSAARRCDRLRLIANYIAANALDYTNVPAVIALLTNRTEFELAFDDKTLVNDPLDDARRRFCVEEPGPYDPLRKREVVEKNTHLVEYDDESEPIDRIIIEPLPECVPPAVCATYLHAICWLSDQEYDYNKGLPSPEVQIEAGQDIAHALKDMTQPIWRPNTLYALQVETREVVAEKGSDGKLHSPVTYRRAYTFGFKTAGPLGHYHQIGDGQGSYRTDYAELAARDREGEYRYASLKHYINRNKSYPDPEGNLIDAKPLYYLNAKLSLVYDVDYVDSMYSRWESGTGLVATEAKLVTVIKDSATAGADSDIVVDAGWKPDLSPTVRSGMRTFRNMMRNMAIDGKDCLLFEPVDQDRPVQRTEVDMHAHLKPQRLYTALFNAVYKSNPSDPDVSHQVHSYVFQTSRYESFEEHIMSYYLDPPLNAKRAVAMTEVVLDAARLAEAQTMVIDPDDPSLATLKRDYPEEYDRLVDGILRVGGLLPPITTEVVIVRSGSTVIGLLVRSPEPFNNPRIPREQDAPTKTVPDTISVAGIDPSLQKIYFSKDLSRIFITTSTLSALSGEIEITMNYLLFSGSDYIVYDSVTIPVTIPA